MSNKLVQAIEEVAIPSLRYCEEKYDHDDQARLNLEAAVELHKQEQRLGRPTEPGWYWLMPYWPGTEWGWEIVQVVEGAFENECKLFALRTGWRDEVDLANYADDQWGGKITQEPVAAPELPF